MGFWAARGGGRAHWVPPARDIDLPTFAARRPCAAHFGVARRLALSIRARPAPLAAGPTFHFVAAGRCASRGLRLPGAAATRPPREPAWHRRARRARAEARTLVRLDAARARLAAHHSAQGGGMSRRGGANGGANAGQQRQFSGGAGDGGMQAARQFFLSLFGGPSAERGRPADRNRGGGRGDRRGGGAPHPRDGEWACRCGFPTNRPYREACFMCGRDRDSGELQRTSGSRGGGGATGKGSAKGRSHNGGDERMGEGRRGGGGPVGADGARPLLGRGGSGLRGGQDAAVHEKGKGNKAGKGVAPWAVGKATGIGASQGAGGVDGARAASGGAAGVREEHGKGKGEPKGARAWTRPTPMVDDEGFETVQPRRVRVQGDADVPADQFPQLQPPQAPMPQQCARQRWSDVDSDDGDYAMDDRDADDDDGDGRDDEEEGDQEVDPKALKAAFDAHAKMVRDLERRGPAYRDSPALATLRAARDAAESAWREAKAPAPLPIRMGRAESKMDRAAAALTRARYALDEFDEWTENRREELVRAVDEADGWYRWRQQQLDQLHGEAGDKVAAKRQGADTAGPTTEVRSRIETSFIPAIHEVIEHMEGNPEVIERLSLIAEGLEEAGKHLGTPQNSSATENYDIGGDDSGDDEGRNLGHKGADSRGGRCHGDGARGESKGGKASAWRPEGPGRWSRRSTDDETRPRGRTTATGGNGISATGAAVTTTSAAEGPRSPADGAPREGTASEAPAAAAGAAGAAGSGEGRRSSTRVPAGGDGDNADSDEQAAKYRRRRTDAEARQESDARRAQELHQEQQIAMAAQTQSHQAGAGGFGSEAALSMAAQKFVLEVRQTEARAAKKGVEPKHEGKTLLELSPMELQQWARENLGDESDGDY